MFIDTANIDEIKSALKLGIFKGVTTNPSILASQKSDEKTFISKLNEPSLLVFFQVKGNTSEEMMDYFIRLKKEISVDFGIKIPITMSGLEVIHRIKTDYPEIKILGTVIYTAAQGIMAVAAQCDYIAPYYNRMFQEGNNADEVIYNTSCYIEAHKASTKIMAASFKSTAQVVSALTSGAHTVTMSYDILVSMLKNKSVVSDLQVFNKCEY